MGFNAIHNISVIFRYIDFNDFLSFFTYTELNMCIAMLIVKQNVYYLIY